MRNVLYNGGNSISQISASSLQPISVHYIKYLMESKL